MLKAANGQVNTDSGSVLLKRETQVYGISEDDVKIIREKEGVIVARVHYGDTTAILKCFEIIRLALSVLRDSEPWSVSGRDGRVDGMRELWKCHAKHGT